jgi:hypothetical protein
MEREPNELKHAFEVLRGLPAENPRARALLARAVASAEPPARSRRRVFPFLLLAAGLMGALLVGAVLQRRPGARAPDTVPAIASPETSTQSVQFVIVASDANTVSLVGDFNDWDPGASPLQRAEGGVWSVVLPLRTGQFTYSFLVNGREWRADPEAPRAAGEDFDRPSSIVLVSRTEP